MEGWAKGLKDRAERAANQLSQVSTAFMPPEDGSGGQLEGDPLPTNGDSCREEQANDDLSPTAGVCVCAGAGAGAGACACACMCGQKLIWRSKSYGSCKAWAPSCSQVR